MMTKGSRILVLVAALALGLIYVLPVWKIDLDAPQYPEGLGMVIQVNTIEGKKPNDLNNINNLNHYIGMKRIVPESIPEMKIMPVVVGILMLLGIAAAALGRRKLLYLWVAGFLLVSVGGLVDFWKWEYDYGHNLDEEHAIIKVPGMNYQPPLIGARQLLNFRARSWPGAGGWIAIASCLVGLGVAGVEFRRRNGDSVLTPTPAQSRRRAAPVTAALALIAASASLTACAAPGPRPLQPGVDRCEGCLMSVADDGHGAEIITTTGVVHTFDSVECMVAFLQSELDADRFHSAWVTDFSNPPALVRADRAFFLRSQALTSPMGMGLTAFARLEDRDGAVNAFGGTALDWAGVQAEVERAWPGGRPPMAHGGHGSRMPVPASHD